MVRDRLRILIALLVLPFLAILGKLAALQLLPDPEREEELDRAENRRRRITLLPPTRGSILDRNGAILARDITTFDLEFTLQDLLPRERFLPTIERALNLCDDRCRGVSAPDLGDVGGCRGAVIEEHLQLILEEWMPGSLDPGGRAPPPDLAEPAPQDPALVEDIPQALKARTEQRLRRMGGMGLVERSTGIYFIPAQGGRSYELRARPAEALAMELALGRIAGLTGRPFAALRAAVAAAEAQVATGRNATERDMARRQRRLLVSDIADRAVTEVVYQPELYPGIRVVDGRRRLYPQGESTAALVGYLRAPAEREVAEGLVLDRYNLDIDFVLGESFKALRWLGSREGDGEVGAKGIEEYYDARLRGAYGVRVEEVDARHVPRKLLEEVLPERGETLRSSLDLELQNTLNRALDEVCGTRRDARAGCAAVMDLTPRGAPGGGGPPGAILAACGYPRFDPHAIRGGSYFQEILARENTEGRLGILLNRPLQVYQQPGSIFKLVVAAAAMEGGMVWPERGGRPVPAPITRSTRFRCTHTLDRDNVKSLRCLSTTGHGQPDGEVDLVQALQYSCNIYFYHLGRERLAPQFLWAWARELGYGRSTGIDLNDPTAPPDRPAGILKSKVRRDGMLHYAIGHGQVTASALQVLRSVAGLALGGRQLPRPYLVTASPPERLALAPETVAAIQEGMRRAVHAPGGTAADDALGLNRYRIAAKTGTAELNDGDPRSPDPLERPLNCAWIAGYAPFDRPEVAFVVLLERTPLHGGDCARVLAPALELLARREPEKYRVPGAKGAAEGGESSPARERAFR